MFRTQVLSFYCLSLGILSVELMYHLMRKLNKPMQSSCRKDLRPFPSCPSCATGQQPALFCDYVSELSGKWVFHSHLNCPANAMWRQITSHPSPAQIPKTQIGRYGKRMAVLSLCIWSKLLYYHRKPEQVEQWKSLGKWKSTGHIDLELWFQI